MSSVGHKVSASFLLNRKNEKKYDPFQNLYDLNLGLDETSKVFNVRMVNLNNLPPYLGSKGNRIHSGVFIRACHGTQQNTAKSLDLLRQVIQNSINSEINKIVQKYLDLYFLPAKRNIGMNNEVHEVSQEHLLNVSCQILEEAKKMYIKDFHGTRCDGIDNSNEVKILPKERKRTFSSGSDSKLPAMSKKFKHIPLSSRAGSGRSTPNKGRSVEPVKKEGPRWDSKRMTSDTLFIMGSKANKALGLGATRGRLYIKHPDVFKYAGDQDDKQWLYEKMHMPATGGRTYLLMVEDIIHLSQTDEYRNSPGLMLNELVGFTVPPWMLEKMKQQMEAQRTDKGLRNTHQCHSGSTFVQEAETEAGQEKHSQTTDSEHSSELASVDDVSDGENDGNDYFDSDDPRDKDYTGVSHLDF